MRIAMVSEHASPLAALGGADAGGQNVHVGALAQALAAQGHRVVVHTRRDDPDISEWVTTPSGVLVHHVAAGPARRLAKDELLPWMGDFAAVLGEVWERNRPDIVHAHFWMSGLASRQAATAVGVPVVQTFHALGSVKRRYQGDADTSPPQRVGLEAQLVDEVDHVIATCADEVAELELLGADTRRVSIVPCGVDLAQFRPDGPRWPRGRRPRLAVVGRLVERKGVADVVAAMADVPDAELVVAGGPPRPALGADAEVARLRLVADANGVPDRVRFLGQVGRRDMPALLRSCDAVVCVPRYEPFGIVPLEAMACGVPVVASAVGGLKESVVDGGTGVLVPAGDVGALAGALRTLIADPALRRGMGRAGVARARHRYGWPGIARSTTDVYRQVMSARSTPAGSR
ncbi:glycosyltransferase [Acidiferrimicrobium sp. IK]|uniref:glycosyltransferase n=1 Tax=Acidiferrimicrobium sp. IK TaxID=2871700 RepID=UPI0021CB54E2|nr:glycosyltransferase [Acidiferrimicrobium sp. IK]MCU4183092.1 glycosyltransferase [Acidiferrimicrobium sp. IK]